MSDEKSLDATMSGFAARAEGEDALDTSGEAGLAYFGRFGVDQAMLRAAFDKALAHGADLSHFAFLTGELAAVEDVLRRYAIYRKADDKGSVDHAFLTSIVDRDGVLRVQYMGTRFDPKEFIADLQSLRGEGARR